MMNKRLFFALSPLLLLLSGCQSDEWLDKHEPINYTTQQKITLRQDQNPADKKTFLLSQSSQVETDHFYNLAELIDLALSHHANLKIAWQQAKQTTIASDLVKSTYLPLINGSVIAGYQKNDFDLPYDIDVDGHTKAVIPSLALQWLLFDFGQRDDFLDATKALTQVAHHQFDLVNQTIVQQITFAYYNYINSVKQRQLNEQSLKNNQVIQNAVLAKRKMGFATVVEVAQVNQLVSASKLNVITAHNQEKSDYQLLIQAMDLKPLTKINVKLEPPRALPEQITPNIEQWIQLALAQRPDVRASYEVMKAKEANIKAAEKSYLPKVYMAANWAHAKGYLGVQSLPDINQTISGKNILFGIGIPLYDGGSRGLRLEEAKSQLITSQEQHQNIKNNAAHEIIMATNALNSALEAHSSALDLVKTTQITYDSVFASYQNGFATIALLNEAAKNLNEAQTIANQTYTASLVEASVLAFTLGYTQNSSTILN